MIDPALAEAARFERDRRAASYPAKIARLAAVGEDGPASKNPAEVGEDGPASKNPAEVGQDGPASKDTLTIDYQCWAAIAEWLETGRMAGFHGGADPEGAAAVWIGWPELEAAAERAVARANVKCDGWFTTEDVKAGAYEQACARRAALWTIHRKVKRMRADVDWLNAQFRKTPQQEIAA